MRVAMRGEEPETWKAPGGVVRREVRASDDRVVAPGCRARGDTYTEYFLRRHVPAALCPRGTRRDDRNWWQRTRDDVGTRVGEWAREAWDDLRGRARRAVGRDDAVDPDQGTRPAREEREERREPVTEVRTDTVPPEPTVVETVPVKVEPAEPRDTLRIRDPRPSEPRDTLVIPARDDDPVQVEPPARPPSPQPLPVPVEPPPG
jgi:penicillin-binding protein 1A